MVASAEFVMSAMPDTLISIEGPAYREVIINLLSGQAGSDRYPFPQIDGDLIPYIKFFAHDISGMADQIVRTLPTTSRPRFILAYASLIICLIVFLLSIILVDRGNLQQHPTLVVGLLYRPDQICDTRDLMPDHIGLDSFYDLCCQVWIMELHGSGRHH